MNNRVYKSAVGVAVGAALLLVWINGAIGLIGDDDATNMLYLGVLIVGLIGAFRARFAPQGMARAAFAMAIAQSVPPCYFGKRRRRNRPRQSCRRSPTARRVARSSW